MRLLARRSVRAASLACALALAAWGCRPAASPAPEAAPDDAAGSAPVAEDAGGAGDEASPSPAEPAVFAVFEGDLPCADCAGIRTRLTLFAEGDRYRLEETRLGAGSGARPRTVEGTWTTLRGSADDPDATVYVLDPRDPKRERNFLRLDENAIEQLDRDQRRVRPPERYRLTRADGP